MSNGSRIEVATRQHVNAVLTSEQISELVKLSDPTNSKGVYPSDVAGKGQEDGALTFRGKVAYGDLVLEYMGANSFKVLPTEQIVRRPSNKKEKTAIAASTPVIAAKAAPVAETPAAASNGSGKKKSGKVSGKQPVAPRKKAMLTQ